MRSYIGNANRAGGLCCRHDECAGRMGVSKGAKMRRKRQETPQQLTGPELKDWSEILGEKGRGDELLDCCFPLNLLSFSGVYLALPVRD